MEGEILKRREDKAVFREVIRILSQGEALSESPGRLILRIGRFFLGAPYRGGTLETGRTERLVVNLRELDCVTFVENGIALAWLSKSRQKSFDAFCRLLRKIRYRQGRLKGYASRLHYFSDWIQDNEDKGIVRDVTEEIGGRPFRKAVNFMTTHPALYPSLKQAALLQRVKAVERSIRNRRLFFIPRESLRSLEAGIRDGDLIAVTAKTRGLDVLHAGFAARVRNRIHLLHASSAEGRVVLSAQPLDRYLMANEARSGIMVARLASTG